MGCEPSRIFHGRVPHNILDNRLGLNPNPKISPTTDFAEELQKRTQILIDKTKKNIMQSYLKYKEYYDRKAKAAPLQQGDYCFILQPLADNQESKIPFREFRWIGPYVMDKIQPNENYNVRKLNSNKTQILHRIRLRKHTPNTEISDVRPEGNLQADDEIIIPQDDLHIISWETEFDNFPSYSDLPNTLAGSPGDADQPDTIITDLDHWSTRRDQNTDDPAAEQHGDELDELDRRSARLQHDTNSAESEQLPEQSAENAADTDLRSTRQQSTTDLETDTTTSESTSEAGNSDFSNSKGKNTIVLDLSDKETDDSVVENESPRGGRYNLRPNSTPQRY